MAIASILKKVFGSKADRDLKQIRPVLNKVLEAYGPIDKLSNDELRAKTEELKARLRECEAPFEKRIAEIKAKLDEDIPVHERETCDRIRQACEGRGRGDREGSGGDSSGGFRHHEIHGPQVQGERHY